MAFQRTAISIATEGLLNGPLSIVTWGYLGVTVTIPIPSLPPFLGGSGGGGGPASTDGHDNQKKKKRAIRITVKPSWTKTVTVKTIEIDPNQKFVFSAKITREQIIDKLVRIKTKLLRSRS